MHNISTSKNISQSQCTVLDVHPIQQSPVNTNITHIYFRNVLISFVAAANYYNISLIKKLYKKICLIMRFTSQIGSVASTVVFSKMHNKNPGIINVTLNIYKIYFRITIPNDLSFLQYSFQCKSLFLFICPFLWLLKKIKMKKNSIQWHKSPTNDLMTAQIFSWFW